MPKGSVELLFLTRWGPQIFYDFRSVLPYVCSTDSMYCLIRCDLSFFEDWWTLEEPSLYFLPDGEGFGFLLDETKQKARFAILKK